MWTNRNIREPKRILTMGRGQKAQHMKELQQHTIITCTEETILLSKRQSQEKRKYVRQFFSPEIYLMCLWLSL